MPVSSSYDYALVHLVPSVERGEFINVGVILFCRTRRFLGALMHLDEQRALALAPQLDLQAVQQHLDAIPLICAGGKEAGCIGQLSQSERFHWLVSPRSTIIQTSPVHSGLCDDPQAALRHLFQTMVLL
jgi:hypothetical protein